ncbi:MAG TPA: hypothetical protein VGE66_17665 [Chitinophagaceae bacterium]
MDKASFHINSFGKALLLPLLLVLCLSANSQEEDDAMNIIDSTLITEVEALEEENPFEPVVTDDQQPVTTRPVDRRKVAQMQKDEDFWYVNTAPAKPKAPAARKLPEPRKDPEWLRNLLWVLVVGGFVVLIIWFLLASGITFFHRPPPAVARPEEEEEYSTENLFDIDYESALKRAVAAQNYRLAIRLMYLQTLKEMALHNLIQYRQERTNNDYLMQLFQTGYYKDFFRLTRNFEYAWYGQFAVSPASYEQIRDEFTSFKQRMPS